MDMRTTLYLTLLRLLFRRRMENRVRSVASSSSHSTTTFRSQTFSGCLSKVRATTYYWMGMDNLIMHCLDPPFCTCRPVLIHAGGGDLLWGQHSIQDLRGYRLGWELTLILLDNNNLQGQRNGEWMNYLHFKRGISTICPWLVDSGTCLLHIWSAGQFCSSQTN